MKTTKITGLTLAATILISSCTTSYQATSGVTGAMIGSHVGETIGYLTGHGRFRGENAALGSLIGMGVGTLLGVGIANQVEQNERTNARNRQYDDTPSPRANDYDYQTGGGCYNGNMLATSISDLTYMDADGDGYLSKGETIEVEGFITNTSDTPLQDIVIYLSTNDTKPFTLSPSLTTTLAPGQKIRYTGRVHCNKVRGKSVCIQLNTTYNSKTSTSNTLIVNTK